MSRIGPGTGLGLAGVSVVGRSRRALKAIEQKQGRRHSASPKLNQPSRRSQKINSGRDIPE